MYVQGRKNGCKVSLDYTYKGMRVAYLENDAVRVGVLLDKGSDIFEFVYKPRDTDFMWHAPIPLRKPFTATSALPEGAFHDYYYGGWQVVLPSAGWASEPYMGTFQGLHGEASLLPFEARLIEDTPQQVSIHLSTALYRTPLAFERTLTLKQGVPALFITEKLTNQAEMEFGVMWGQHPALGPPFLDENCVVSAPATKAEVLAYHDNGLWDPEGDYDFPMVKNRRTGEDQDVTQVLPKDTRSVDVVFFKELTAGWYGLTNTAQELGVGMAWDHDLFKYLWMWQVYGGHTDYPWYGRTYNIALEPFTSYPPAGIKNAIDNGTALMMQPSQVIETDMVMVAYEGSGVNGVSLDGSVS